MKPPVFRPGDRVRVLEAVRVVRVGYPKTPRDYLLQAEGLVAGMCLALTTRGRERVADVLSWALAKADHFGGRERTLHTAPAPQLLGQEFIVDTVRSVKTGVYFPPSGGYSSWIGESDYEPGGLAQEKVHRLVTIYPARGPHSLAVRAFITSDLPEVEARCLEKIHA